jgi:Tol biopolymer transport system component
LEVSRLSQDQSVYYTTLSPDGKLIAYATQGSQYNKFWLFSLDHPEDVTELFDDITTDTVLIRAMPLEFSPNSQWIVYTGQSGSLIVAPVTHPQDAALKVDKLKTLLTRWSKDGQWLAIFLSQEKGTEIYHYTDNRWTLYSSTSLPDQPVAFSFDNRYLFTADWHGSNWLNVYDIARRCKTNI